MQKSLFPLALILLCACSSPNEPLGNGQIVGNYRNAVDDDRARVNATANFAVTTEAARCGRDLSLVRIVSAQTQIVAGINYRMILNVRDGGKRRDALVVVWRKLNGECRLTSWDWQ